MNFVNTLSLAKSTFSVKEAHCVLVCVYHSLGINKKASKEDEIYEIYK